MYYFRFVSFSSQDGLQSALSSFNGYEIEGKRLNLQLDDRASGKMPFQDRGIGRPEIGRSRNANQVKVLSCPSSVSEVRNKKYNYLVNNNNNNNK